MANDRNRLVVQHLRRALSPAGHRQRSDKQLLEAFADGEEPAFETLVQRHGPLVLSVCRRVLRNNADADDAFQATFLVLARKAGSTGWHDAIGSWLYQVAYRIALKMRAKRGRQQPQPPARPTTQLVNEMTLGDLRLVLDEELSRLPERYRAPLLLCYLQGKTQDEAARELGWSEGALRGCLFRGREILRTRLAKRGLSVSAVLLASALSQSLAEAAVPSELVALAVAAAGPYAAGQAVVGLVSTTTLVLSKEVLSAMFLAKLKIAALVLLAVGVAGAGAGVLLQPVLAEQAEVADAQDKPAPRREAERPAAPREGERPAPAREAERPAGSLAGIIAAVNSTKTPHSIAVRIADAVISFDVAGDAKLLAGRQAIAIADLKVGQRVVLTFAADQRTVTSIQADGGERGEADERPRDGGERPRPDARRQQFAYGAVTAVDATKRTLSLARLTDGGGQGPVTVYDLAAEVQVMVDRATATLAELTDCRVARAELNGEGKVFRVMAEWGSRDDLRGVIKTVDAANNQFTLTVAPLDRREGGADVKLIGRDMVYTLAKDAKVLINGQAAKLADLKPGQAIVARQADDKVTAIRSLTPGRDGERREGAPRDGERREGAPRDGER